MLLIDERPEEATAWREALPGVEIATATAELAPADQVRVAELALERARRRAEAGADVVLIVDSLSRLAVASGDVAEVKRLFGSGRDLAEEGTGSLTVIATVVEGAEDDGAAERAVITTESSLLRLDPELAAAGVFPALRAAECRVSNEEKLRERRGARGGSATALAVRRPGPDRGRQRCFASGSRPRGRTPSCLAKPLAPVRESSPGGLAGELDRLGVALRLDVAEGLGVGVEDDVQLALLDPLVEPGAAEDESADPVHEAAARRADQLRPVLVDVLAERRRGL